MSFMKKLSKGICLSGCALLLLGTTPDADAQKKKEQDVELEKKTGVHRITNTKRSIYDAFTYVNRIPEEPLEGETPFEFTGSIFSRLANQEGRIQLKVPPGMNMETYVAFKTFFRYEGDQLIGDNKIGNCAACHMPIEFTDGKKHVTKKGGTAQVTPSLRNVVARGVDVEKVIKEKIKMAKKKRAGKADEIDDEYLKIKLSKEDINGLVKFLKLLDDGRPEDFRDLILKVENLDTIAMSQVN